MVLENASKIDFEVKIPNRECVRGYFSITVFSKTYFRKTKKNRPKKYSNVTVHSFSYNNC